MSEASAWKNRIVGHGEVDPKDLVPNPLNWKVHPPFQDSVIAGSLEEIGWIQDVIVNRRTLPEWGAEQNRAVILDGHDRVKLALKRGEATVPVKYVDLSPREERLALATLDPSAGLADPDADKLTALLEGLESEHAALNDLLLEQEAKAQLAATEDEADYSHMQSGKPGHTFVELVILVEQHQPIEKAIERARTQHRCSRGEALVKICEEYLAPVQEGYTFAER